MLTIVPLLPGGHNIDKADGPMQIDWTITRPDGHPVRGCAGTAGHDPMIEANLNALHHGLVEDFAIALYEASRHPTP